MFYDELSKLTVEHWRYLEKRITKMNEVEKPDEQLRDDDADLEAEAEAAEEVDDEDLENGRTEDENEN